MENEISAVQKSAKAVGFEIIGKLRRLPDYHYGLENKWCDPMLIDEAGNRYRGSYKPNGGFSIITRRGAVIVSRRIH